MYWSITLVCALLGQADATAQGDSAPSPSIKQEAAKQKLRQEVDRQIRQILRGDLKQREQATQKLIDLGPGVLDVLPPTTLRTPAALRLVLDRVRVKLEKQAAADASKAARITLKGEMNLLQAMAAIEKQSGNRMLDLREQFGQPRTNPKLKLTLQNTPFWQALDDVLDLAELTTYGYPDKPGVAFVNRDEGEKPRKDRRVDYSGPFRIEIVQILARRDFRNPGRALMNVTLETSWEPRLKLINLQLSTDSIQALDELGRPLPVSAKGVVGAEIVPGTYSTELTLPFVLPGRNVKKIATLKGKMRALAPGRVDVYKFEKLKADQAKPRTQGRSGVKVILNRIRKNGDSWEINVIVSFEKTEGALASHRDWVLNNETYLLAPSDKKDSQDKKIEYGAFETSRRTETEIGVSYFYDLSDGPDGLTLVYKTPSVIMILPVEFEIKNIDLP